MPEAEEGHGGERPAGRVVVVGAGLSGLIAARELHRRGIDVVVLESADRVGGRAMARTSALGSRLDLGGQWIGHDHHRVVALAAELGVTRFPMHTGRLPRLVDGDRRVPLTSPQVLLAGLVLLGVGALARVGAPERWNAVTLARWLCRVPGHTSRRLLELVASTSWTDDLDRFSVPAMTRMIRAQGGLRTMLATRGGAQDSLLVEGVGTLTERLADGLGPRVRTGRRVTSVLRDDEGVTVRTDDGDLRAAKVIVTAAPPIAARIAHEPPLPPERAGLERNTHMGSVRKVIAVYERPFWRERGGGEFLCLDGPGRAVFDSGPPDGPGHLCVLLGGTAGRALDHMDAAERRAAVLGPLVAHVGSEVLDPVDWHEKAWHLDEHVGGGYIALPDPGTTDGFAPVPAGPVGHVHWAGAESAREHPGYLDGAIEAGERAAREVAEELARATT